MSSTVSAHSTAESNDHPSCRATHGSQLGCRGRPRRQPGQPESTRASTWPGPGSMQTPCWTAHRQRVPSGAVPAAITAALWDEDMNFGERRDHTNTLDSWDGFRRRSNGRRCCGTASGRASALPELTGLRVCPLETPTGFLHGWGDNRGWRTHQGTDMNAEGYPTGRRWSAGGHPDGLALSRRQPALPAGRPHRGCLLLRPPGFLRRGHRTRRARGSGAGARPTSGARATPISLTSTSGGCPGPGRSISTASPIAYPMLVEFCSRPC